MKHLPLIVLALSILPLSAQAQNHPREYMHSDVKIVPVKSGIHLLISPNGGNVTASTGEDGTFIIDDQLSGRTETITNAIKTVSKKPIKFVLNTHYHFDHTGGNETLGEAAAIIVAHDNVRERLSERQFITYFKKEMLPTTKSGLPSVTFSNGMNLHYNNDDIQITHVKNAHTDGDAIAFFQNANVIVAGDTIFNNTYPFIDAEHGGSLKGLLNAHKTILELADDETTIIPGHGVLMDEAALETYSQALTTISQRIETSIKDGKTREETISAKPTAEFDEKMGNGIIDPDAFVSFLYGHLNH